MWEWKLAVWWNRDNKGRAREKFANSKIEARSVEHGKLLPPSIFCYYQPSGHRPIGSVASSWVEGLCFDLNYQSFRYLLWTDKDSRNLINKCSEFSTCIGWSSKGRLWMFYFYTKLEQRQQPIFQMQEVARWKRSWLDEVSGVKLQHFFGHADSLVCKTIREICWVGIDADEI